MITRTLLAALFLGGALVSAAHGQDPSAAWVRAWSSSIDAERARFNPQGQLLVYSSERVATLSREQGELLASEITPRGHTWDLGEGRRVLVARKTLSLLQAGTAVGSLEHSSGLDHFAFDPKHDRGALASSQKEILIVELKKVRVRHTLKGHQASVNDVAFSRDGKLLASADQGGEIRVWDPAKGLLLKVLEAKGVTFSRIVFTPGGELISSDFSRTIRFWDPTTGACAKVLPALQKIQSMALSSDGKTLATGHWGSAVRLWDVPSRKLISTLKTKTGVASGLAFSSDGEWLAIVPGPLSGSLTLWHKGPVAPPALKGPWTGLLPNDHASVCFGPRGKVLYGAGNLLVAHEGPKSLALSGPLAGGEFCGRGPTGAVFLRSGVLSKKLTVAHLPYGSTTLETLLEIDAPTSSSYAGGAALDPKGRVLALEREVSKDKAQLELYDLETKKRIRVLPTSGDHAFSSLAFSNDGGELAFGSRSSIQVFDTATGNTLHTFEAEVRGGISFSKDGTTIYAFSRRGVSAYRDKKELWKLKISRPTIMARAAFHLGTQRAAVSGADGVVRVIDLRRGKVFCSFPSGEKGGMARVGLAFGPEGDRLAISSSKRKLTQIVSLKNPPPPDPKEFFLGTIREARAAAKKAGKRVVALFVGALTSSKNEALEEALAAPEVKAMSDSFLWVRRPLDVDFAPSEEAKALKLPRGDPLVVILDPKRARPLGWIKEPRLLAKALKKSRPKGKKRRKKRRKRDK
jgi:WD40 repeat protein